jgi:hypothetical protein
MVLAGITTLGLGLAARADTPAPAPKADKPATVAAPLTDESLAQMLTVMGYEFRAEPVKGTVIYHVNLDQDGWTFHLQVALSNDKNNLWISSAVVNLTNDMAQGANLQRLLEENENIGPDTIYYDKKTKRISLQLPMLNKGGISPVVFRTYLNTFLTDVKGVKKLCDSFKPADKAAKADKPEASK